MKIVQNMKFERSTPGSHLYSAPFANTAKIRNIYLPKKAFEGNGNPPQFITVTVTETTEAEASVS